MAKKDHVRRLNRSRRPLTLAPIELAAENDWPICCMEKGCEAGAGVVSGEPGAFDPVLLKRVDGRQMNAGAIRASTPTRRNGDGPPGSGTQVITRPKTQTRKPSMYRVLLLNDDYTPMEFVVTVLVKYFSKNREDAWRIMMHVH